MPQAIPLVIKAVAFVGSGSVALGAAKIAIMAGSYAYSSAQARKLKRAMASIRDQGTTASFPNPVASRKIIYGRMRVGGTTVFAHTTGTKNEQLHMVIALCKHPVHEIGETFFGEEGLGNPWGSGNAPHPSSKYY